MNISELNAMLVYQVEDVCRRLLPNGRQKASEWRVGGLSGEVGDSLGVCLKGAKKGIWSDFATGEAGDLIDLWREVNRLSMVETLKEVKNYLGVKDDREEFVKQYKPPVVPKNTTKPKSQVHHWLNGQRRITPQAIEAYQLGESGDYVIFPFKLADKLRMVKKRNIHDKHDVKPTSAEQEPCLFGWQAIPETQRVAYITEGELDACAMYVYGYPALSVPFGGGKGAKQVNWIENEFHNLERFEEIYLCLDNDGPGQEAVKEIINRLGADRCRVVELPHKDANECLMNAVHPDLIAKAIRNARTLDPDELKSAFNYADNVIKMLHPDGQQEPGFFSPWAKARDLIYFRYSELSISNGVNGHGKSQIVGDISLAAMAQGERVCIASMELTPARLLARLTRQAAGMKSGVPSPEYIKAIHDWYRDRLWIYECTGSAKTKRLLETFAYARRRYGVRVFVIDSLMKCGIGEDDYNAQKEFVEALCDFKHEHDCHIFLVTHSRKGESEEKPTGKFDVKGTGSITDLADNVFTIWRNKRKERELSKPEHEQESKYIDMPDCLFICSKQRNGDWEGTIGLWFDRNSYQYLGSENDRLREYVKFSKEQGYVDDFV